MTTGKKKASGGIPVAWYIRMSSAQQQDSPQAQRAELAKQDKANGYCCVEEYFDAAISGVKSRNRPEFQRMIEDAKSGRFKFICVRGQDRFGRFDAAEANHYWHLLRESGVQVHSVTEGIINIDDLGGWLTASVTQFGKLGYVKDLARNTSAARLRNAKAGHAMGSLCYGFDRIFKDASGEFKYRAKYREGFVCQRGWRGENVPTEDKLALEAIRTVFDLFVTTDLGAIGVAKEMNLRGYSAPSGKKWSYETVRNMLRNNIYIGTLSYGRASNAKFFSCHLNGDLGPPDKRRDRFGSAVVQLPNAHAPIVSPAVFELAQEKIRQRSQLGIRPRSDGGSLLAGLVHCGHCGGRMYSRGKCSGGDPSYYCSTIIRNGGCVAWQVRKEALEPSILSLIADTIFTDKNIDRFAKAANAKAKERSGAKEATRIAERLAEAKSRHERAVENYVDADRDLRKAMQAKVNEMKQRVADLERELEAAKRSSDAPRRTAEHLRELVAKLRVGNASDKVDAMRFALRSMVERVDVFYVNASGTGIHHNLKRRASRAVVKLIGSVPICPQKSFEIPL